MRVYFGFSKLTASEYVDLPKPILKKALLDIDPQTVRVFNDQASFDRAFEGVTDIIICNRGFHQTFRKSSNDAHTYPRTLS